MCNLWWSLFFQERPNKLHGETHRGKKVGVVRMKAANGTLNASQTWQRMKLYTMGNISFVSSRDVLIRMCTQDWSKDINMCIQTKRRSNALSVTGASHSTSRWNDIDRGNTKTQNLCWVVMRYYVYTPVNQTILIIIICIPCWTSICIKNVLKVITTH